MKKNIELEYDRFLDPILSDENIWTRGNVFMDARFEMYAKVSAEGYGIEDFFKISKELTRRRKLMMEEYFKRTGLDYTL